MFCAIVVFAAASALAPLPALAQSSDTGAARSAHTNFGRTKSPDTQHVYAAAQLYQDARYDYSMGYVGSAIANLRSLLRRYPNSAFARQGRKDLEMLLAEARRSTTGTAQARSSNREMGFDGEEEDSLSQFSLTAARARNGSASRNGGANQRPGALNEGVLKEEYGPPSPQQLIRSSGAKRLAQKRAIGNRSLVKRSTMRRAVALMGEQKEASPPASPPALPPLLAPVLSPVQSSVQTKPGQKLRPTQSGQPRSGPPESRKTHSRQILLRARLPRPVGQGQGQRNARLRISRLARTPAHKRYNAAMIRRFNAAFQIASSDRIFFARHQAELEQRARSVIAAQARWLVKHEDLTVRIVGHADEGGSKAGDVAMSRRRGEAVRDFLIGKGIAGDRILVQGRGRTGRIALCKSPVCAAQNRRVVIELTSN